ncbi:MAG: hypothetical protein ABSD38_12930 [Syntrophorhabdales bacterium]|jgi:hypothetical protein
MASAYRSFKLALHKGKDRDLIAFLEDLPVMMRHHFVIEALNAYRTVLGRRDAQVEAEVENHPEPDISPLHKVRIKT